MIFIYYDYDYALMRLATDVFALTNATGYSAMWHVRVLEFNFNVVMGYYENGGSMMLIDS